MVMKLTSCQMSEGPPRRKLLANINWWWGLLQDTFCLVHLMHKTDQLSRVCGQYTKILHACLATKEPFLKGYQENSSCLEFNVT